MPTISHMNRASVTIYYSQCKYTPIFHANRASVIMPTISHMNRASVIIPKIFHTIIAGVK